MKHQAWLPNFLGIGGQRCGSKWLHTNLRQHPDLWLPPVKELHYFDRAVSYDSPSTLASDRLVDRLFGRQEHHRRFRARAKRILGRSTLGNPLELAWKLKYFCGTYNDAWYASLFKPGRHKVRGEITPSYSILNHDDVARIHALMPGAKIIFIMRNPVQRTWSNVQLGFSRRTLSESRAREMLLGPTISARSDYLSILSTWEGVFPPQQMFVEFFDELVENPERLLSRVYEFLDVPSGPQYIWPSIREKRNASPPQKMPAEVKLALTKKYEPLIAAMSDRFGGHATRWLEEARATLDGHHREAA
jgi:Sulfotransferase family